MITPWSFEVEQKVDSIAQNGHTDSLCCLLRTTLRQRSGRTYCRLVRSNVFQIFPRIKRRVLGEVANEATRIGARKIFKTLPGRLETFVYSLSKLSLLWIH